jgi:ankyrin repeat protein
VFVKHPCLCSLLCNKGSCRPSLVSDSEERTPLHWAVDRGHLNAVEVLVNSNADVNAQVSDFICMLHSLHSKFPRPRSWLGV